MAASHCLEVGCRYDRKDNDEMLRCCLCCTWYHLYCVKLKPTDTIGVWPCPKCRNINKTVNAMDRKIDQLLDMMQKSAESITTLTEQCKTSENELSKCRTDYNDLQKENTALRKQVTELTETLHKTVMECLDKSNGSLLIGDSTVKNIDPKKLVNTEVISIPDGKVTTMAQKLQDNKKRYAKVYICAGSNECSMTPLDIESLKKDFKKLIDTAKEKVISSTNVVISSIPPRIDSTAKSTNVDSLNQALSQINDQNGTTFINHDTGLKLGDGSTCEAFLQDDGANLNNIGLLKVAKKMCIPIKPGFESNIFQTTTGSSLPKQDSAWQVQQPRRRPWRKNYPENQRHMPSRRPNSMSGPCGFCAETNHKEDKCHHGEPVTCHTCGQKGHKAKYHETA